ncbi:MAG: hypothetical protein P4L84_07545 [Isosphaeraceae bacterium]|nr:hypothetical protein [Isosphaeraceae bacterium]
MRLAPFRPAEPARVMTDTRSPDRNVPSPSDLRKALAPPALPRDPAEALVAAAPWVQFGTWAIGLLFALETLLAGRPSFSPEARLSLRASAVIVLLLYGVIGLAAGRLLAAFARLVDTQRTRADAAAQTLRWCEDTLGPALTRLTEALERSGVGTATGTASSPSTHNENLSTLRRTIAEREWAVAEQLIRDFAVAYPEHPEAALLAGELAQGREAATHDLMARLDAARAANDPDRVLELRDALTLLLSGEPLRALDRDLAKWFLHVIQKRLRAGGVKPDIPLLAARVADALDTTPEGASLRASLPTLRRSAGLCARCAEPYAGIADACPKCLATAAVATAPPPPSVPDEPEDEDFSANGRADDPFLRDDEDE